MSWILLMISPFKNVKKEREINLGSEAPRPLELPSEAPQPAPRRKRTGLYIGIVVIAIVVIGAMAVLSSLPKLAPTLTPAKPIHHIDYFLVSQKGDIVQTQFALMSEDLDFVSTDGTVKLTISDEATNRTVYETEFVIKKSDFKYYQTLLGKTILAYQWSFPVSSVQKCISNGIGKLTFTASDGKRCSETNEYITLPKYTEEEIKQMYESQYQQSATAIGQTITKEDFSITLVKVGYFTHLKYDSWGDEVTQFRLDLKVKNIASESEYLFESNIVIVDNIGNQYNYEYDGTLDLGEIYPQVTKEGYVLFPAINESATTITVTIKQTAYPEDILYQFIVSL